MWTCPDGEAASASAAMTICRVHPQPATRSGGSDVDFSSVETVRDTPETHTVRSGQRCIASMTRLGHKPVVRFRPPFTPPGSFLDFADSLQRFLVEATGDPTVTVDDLKRHTEGFSLETVSFTAAWDDGGGRVARRLVLRRQPAAGLLEPYDLAPQVTAMRAVEGALAVPRVRWFEQDAGVLGAPFYVMDFVEADVPLPVLARDG